LYSIISPMRKDNNSVLADHVGNTRQCFIILITVIEQTSGCPHVDNKSLTFIDQPD
jgi:hypothetical protein